MIGETFDGNTRNKTGDAINVHWLLLQFFDDFPIPFGIIRINRTHFFLGFSTIPSHGRFMVGFTTTITVNN